METIKDLVRQMQNLSNSSPQSTELSPEKTEISLYADTPAGPKDIVDASVRVKKAFPALPTSFYDMFDDRIREKGFTKQRLKDAVNYVIDNCQYPTPTMANFINYDRTVRFKTYDEMCKEALTSDSIWREWLAVKYPDMPKTVWVHANDVQKYNLQKYVITNG